jgi:hypothetical protein
VGINIRLPPGLPPGANAQTFLSAFLAAGPQPAMAVAKTAKRLGIDPSTLARCKARIGVVSERSGKTWQWRLPTMA